jgi:V-type H+-transporting ATPase subunit E
MKPEEENIQALSRAILRDAQEEAQQVQAEALAKVDEIRQRASQQAETERNAILERAEQEAERLRSQVAATAQLKARTLQLEQREKLLDKVFAEARQRLGSVKKRADYEQVTVQLLREALAQLKGGQAQVRADEATRKHLKAKTLEQVAKEMRTEITVGDPLEEGTGLIIESSDGRVQYDNTLETRLARMQSVLRSAVYQVLMGEKL